MPHGNATPLSRAFTIHFKGELFRALIDCRTAPTLRDLLAVAIPTPSSSDPNRFSPTTEGFSAYWVNDCICTFGGQRISLDTPTESAPTVLNLSLSEGDRGGTRKRGRPNCVLVKKESLKYPSSQKMGERIVPGDWKGGSVEVKTRLDEKHSSISVKPVEEFACSSTIIYDATKEPSADDNDSNDNGGSSDDEEDGDSDGNGGYTSRRDHDDRQYEGILPIVVGGVVRLVNTDSRDKSHEWTVYVRGLFNESNYLSDCIESVRFTLDASFVPSERVVTSVPFELTEVGWGEFIVKISVQLRYYPRPIQVLLSPSAPCLASTTPTKPEPLVAPSSNSVEKLSTVKAAAKVLSLSPSECLLVGLENGPNLSPLVSVLNQHRYLGGSGSRFTQPTVKRERSDDETEKSGMNKEFSTTEGVEEALESALGASSSKALYDSIACVPSEVENLGMCSGVVVLTHLLRFSHRTKRPHCIPPLGRPYEPEVHVGYTLVQPPVVTEHYDEIVIPDAPAELRKTLSSLPDLFRQRVSLVKAARSSPTQQHGHRGGASLDREALGSVYRDDGVSCWKYIKNEELDDMALAEAYLDNVIACPQSFLPIHQETASAGQSAVTARPGRGRRKLLGAEIDLRALRVAKKGLTDAIERMRWDIALRQAAHVFQQYK